MLQPGTLLKVSLNGCFSRFFNCANGNRLYKAFHIEIDSSGEYLSLFLTIHQEYFSSIWVKVFKNESSRICGRQPLKNSKLYGLLRQAISLQIIKDCFLQILLRPFLNTLTHMQQHWSSEIADKKLIAISSRRLFQMKKLERPNRKLQHLLQKEVLVGQQGNLFLKFTLKQLQKIESFFKKSMTLCRQFQSFDNCVRGHCLLLNKQSRFFVFFCFCFSCKLFDDIHLMIYFIINLVVHLRKRWGSNVPILRR